MNFFQNIKTFFQGPGNFQGPARNHWTEDEIKSFSTRLRQVIFWTNQLSKDFDFDEGFYGTVFRKTNPMMKETPLYKFDGDYATWNVDDYDPELYEQILEQVLVGRPSGQIDLSQLSQLGRILSFETCITTHDGAPIVESKCFVDEGDVPPIDTWFFLKSNYYHFDNRKCDQALFCWIPRKFESVMQSAINVEILDSYRWVDENDPTLIDRLKNVS